MAVVAQVQTVQYGLCTGNLHCLYEKRSLFSSSCAQVPCFVSRTYGVLHWAHWSSLIAKQYRFVVGSLSGRWVWR